MEPYVYNRSRYYPQTLRFVDLLLIRYLNTVVAISSPVKRMMGDCFREVSVRSMTKFLEGRYQVYFLSPYDNVLQRRLLDRL
jgi:hypothetical protein